MRPFPGPPPMAGHPPHRPPSSPPSGTAAETSVTDTLASGASASGRVEGDREADAGASPRLVAEPGARIADCTLIRLLGQGGMGKVFLARQENPEREVAIKLIAGGFIHPDLRARFDREIRALARLRHPGIAQIFSAGVVTTADGRAPYLIMEYVEGLPLREAVEALPLERRVRLLAAIARAVEHAHRCGVIHRDLKPANILVTTEGQPKILDFGVARVLSEEGASATDSKLTHAGFIVGTLAYMSPEQTRTDRDEVDTRSDVYALGLLGFEMLTGHLPYELPRDQYGIVRTIREQPPAPLERFLPRAPRDLSTILAKALAKDKERRYPSAGAFAEDLERFLAREPITARPASMAYRLRKFAERNPLASTAIAAAALILVLSVAAVFAFALREQRARLAAEEASRRANAHLDFVRGVLSQANPSLAGSAHVTVREALSAASRMIEESYADTPEIEVELRILLGNVWLSLAQWNEAMREFDTALARASGLLGAGDPRILAARSERAQAIAILGDLPAAERELAAVVQEMMQTLPPDDPGLLDARRAMVRLRLDLDQTAGVREELADLVARLGTPRDRASRELAIELDNLRASLAAREGDFAEALALRTQQLERSRAYFGPDAMSTLLAVENLAALYARSGDRRKAAELLQGVAEEMGKRLGPDHPVTIRVLNSLAAQELEQGELARAEERVRALLPLLDRLPPRDRLIGLVSSTAATIAYVQGRLEEAIELSRRSLDLALAEQSEEHEDSIRSMLNHANILLAANRNEEAAEWFGRLMEATRRRYGPAHPEALAVTGEYAAFLRDVGRLDEAIAIFEDLRPRIEQRFGRDHERTLMMLYQYAGALQRAGRFEDALPLSAALLDRAEAVLGARHPVALLAPLRHARSLMGLGRFREAREQLDRAWNALKAADASREWRAWVAEALAELSERQGSSAESARWQRRALALRRQTP